MKTRRNFFKAVAAALVGSPIAAVVAQRHEGSASVLWRHVDSDVLGPHIAFPRKDLGLCNVSNLTPNETPAVMVSASLSPSWLKVKELPEHPKLDTVYLVKGDFDDGVRIFVTSKDGHPYKAALEA